MSKKTITLLLLSPIALFIAIQLLPVWLAQTNPAVVAEPQWASQQTRDLAQRACFDCHSNETVWPWYSRVAPVSWLITNDVVDGRRTLNFSEWGVAGTSKLGDNPSKAAREIEEKVSRGSMPPGKYLLLHPEAKLSEAEQQQLIDGLLASISTP